MRTRRAAHMADGPVDDAPMIGPMTFDAHKLEAVLAGWRAQFPARPPLKRNKKDGLVMADGSAASVPDETLLAAFDAAAEHLVPVHDGLARLRGTDPPGAPSEERIVRRPSAPGALQNEIVICQALPALPVPSAVRTGPQSQL